MNTRDRLQQQQEVASKKQNDRREFEQFCHRFENHRENLRSAIRNPGSWADVGSEMIQKDLTEAELPYTDKQGRDFDFHALRHQFITCLSRAGVSLKAAQELARHSKPELTASTYTHLTIKDLSLIHI